MRRLVMVLAVGALLVAATAGVAVAVVKNGTPGPDTINGTGENDEIRGFRGADTLSGLGGNDLIKGGKNRDRVSGNDGRDDLYGGDGEDRIFGGAGNDFVDPVGDGARDFVDCGSGFDTVNQEPVPGDVEDRFENCEVFAL